MGAADINRAYVSIRLWLLLVHMFETVQTGAVGGGMVHENSAKMIWNELWPSFETIVLSLENDALNGSVSVNHSFSSSKSFILIHSKASGNPHLVLCRGAVRLPKASSRVGRIGNLATSRFVEQAPATGWRGRNFKGRYFCLLPNFAYPPGAIQFARLAKNISSPMNEIAFDALVSQTASDMAAAEKLHAFESTRKDRSQTTEKGRREMRVTS